MFEKYKDLGDVVSLLVYCSSEKSYLLNKEPSGEYWLPCIKCEKSCWKITAQKLTFELFGVDTGAQCLPIRIYRVWLPYHRHLSGVYHVVYKVAIKSDIKKRTKLKTGIRSKLQWLSISELERQLAHLTLRSPELLIFVSLATGEQTKDTGNMAEFASDLFIEICEDSVVLGAEGGSGAVVMTSPHYLLLQASGYTRDDQLRIYREFVLTTFPAVYMSQQAFTQIMVDAGWQRGYCQSLFRAADVNGRGGLSFVEFLMWCAALEPATQHSGIIAEIRCRYIFRFFDGNRDMKLEYEEFKELIAAARVARQLSVDALSVCRDTDMCLKQLALPANGQLPLSEFLRAVSELRIRGTSSLLRFQRSFNIYLADLNDREKEIEAAANNSEKCAQPFESLSPSPRGSTPASQRRVMSSPASAVADYKIAMYVVKICPNTPNEMVEILHFDEQTISSSTVRLLAESNLSKEVIGASSTPAAAIAAVRYFAGPLQKPLIGKRHSIGNTPLMKSSWSWNTTEEAMNMAAMLIRMADGVRNICSNESRMLRLRSPVYTIGDLHGNLKALLAMEKGLWPSGPSLVPAKLLFLGDFVDRGQHGTELMAYLFAAKLQRPDGVYLIRGNHESREIQKMFSFFTECTIKYGEIEGTRVWDAINQVFDVLPLAAVVDDKVFCCHGGIPPPWLCPLISAIDKVPLPLSRPSEQSCIAWELMWNDPIKTNKITASLALELAANEGFAANTKRGTGHVFEQAALDRFLLANQLSHVVRAHEVQNAGFLCHFRGRLVSVFSSSQYCGGNNDSGIVLLEDGKLRMITVTNEHL